MAAGRHIRNGKMVVRADLSAIVAVEVDFCTRLRAEDCYREFLLAPGFHPVLLVAFKFDVDRIGVTKFVVVEIESGFRLCCQFDDKAVALLGRLLLHHDDIAADSAHFDLTDLIRSHSVDMQFDTGARAVGAVFDDGVEGEAGDGVGVDRSQRSRIND